MLNKNRVSIALLASLLLLGIILQATTVNAQYPYRYRLTITTNNQAGGYTSPSGVVQVDYGLSYQVTATPNSGYVFSGWYLNGVYQNKLTTITVTMIHDNTLTATFSQQAASLEVSVNPPEAGTTNPSPGILYYPSGTNVQVTVQPQPNYTFNGWYLDGTYAGSETTISVALSGDRKLSAYFGGNSTSPTPTPSTQPTPTPTPVQLPPADLSVTCQSSSTYNGFDVKINGLLTTNGVSVPNAGIMLYLSVTGGSSWDVLSFVNTGSDGAFMVSWKPSVTGNYVLKAVWPGNSEYSTTDEIINFAITPFEEQSVFSVTSNSTLSGLSFDSETKDLSFSTTGPDGSTGYVNVVIPKSLVPDISTVHVFLDGNQISYNSVSQNDAWVVSISYHQSSHDLRLELEKTASAQNIIGISPDTLVLVIAIIGAAIAVILAVALLVRKRKA